MAGTRAGLAVVLVVGLAAGLTVGLAAGLTVGLAAGFTVGLAAGFTVGLATDSGFDGSAAVGCPLFLLLVTHLVG